MAVFVCGRSPSCGTPSFARFDIFGHRKVLRRTLGKLHHGCISKLLIRSEGVAAPLGGGTLILYCFVEARGYDIPYDAGSNNSVLKVLQYSILQAVCTSHHPLSCNIAVPSTQACTGAERWHRQKQNPYHPVIWQLRRFSRSISNHDTSKRKHSCAWYRVPLDPVVANDR